MYTSYMPFDLYADVNLKHCHRGSWRESKWGCWRL